MNLSLVWKIRLAFGVLFLLFLLVGIGEYLTVSHEVKIIKDIASSGIPYFSTALRVKTQMLQLRRFEKDIFLNIGDVEKTKEYLKKHEKFSDEMNILIKELSSLSQSNISVPDDMRKLSAAIEPNYAKYLEGFRNTLETAKKTSSMTPERANHFMTPYKKYIHELETNIDALAAFAVEHINGTTSMAVKDGNRSGMLMLSALIVALLLMITFAALVSFGVSNVMAPVAMIARITEQMAQGNLSERINIKNRKDEIALLAGNLNSTCEQLSKVMGEIQNNSEALASASEEVSVISTQLASGSEEMSSQATTIAGATEEMSVNIKTVAEATGKMNNNVQTVSAASTQISQSMSTVATAVEESQANVSAMASASEEMTSTIAEIARNTERANEATNNAVKSVKQASEQVGELADSSQKIEQIISVIVDIAEQTKSFLRLMPQ